jgi:hypothetical protein
MARTEPVPEGGAVAHALHDRAMDDLRFIRETMERAGGFTVLSGWGQIAIGATALVAAMVAAAQEQPGAWLLVWSIEAVIALAIGGWAVGRKAKASGMPLLATGRKVALGLAPPLVAGALITGVPVPPVGCTARAGPVAASLRGGDCRGRHVFGPDRTGHGALLHAAGRRGPLLSAEWGNALLALGFGGVHIFFGIRIAWRHGG